MNRPAIRSLLLALGVLLTTGTLAQASNARIELSVGGLADAVFSLQSIWDPILENPKIQFGVNLLGPSPYQRNVSTPFKPASTAKLFTTGAFLNVLDPAFRYETRLEWRQIDPARTDRITGLKLVGSGDPSWAMEEFGETLNTRVELFARVLYDRGVREIAGPIELVPTDPRWRNLREPEGWRAEDRTACYGAHAQAFNLQINCASLVIENPSRARWEEFGVPTAVTLQLRRGPQTDLRVIETGEDFTITGTWSPGSAPVTLYLPIRRMESWVRALFERAITRQGILLTGRPPTPPLTSDSELRSFVYYSPEISEILKPFLKKSLNMVGDALFKTLGARDSAAADLVTAGQNALRDFVASLGTPSALALGIAPQPGYYANDIVLRDGSGVSHESSVTPAALMVLLQDLAQGPHFERLWDALPIAGVDGTLADRMKGTPAENFLRAKTGTLNGTYNLAGYVPQLDSAGRRTGATPFLILTQTTLDQREDARLAEDRVGVELSRLARSMNQPR